MHPPLKYTTLRMTHLLEWVKLKKKWTILIAGNDVQE
jgi:hypothetical protein